jgi:hypothetical protein
MNAHDAVQMGNLFAALYIKAPLDNRYGNIHPYEQMLRVVKNRNEYTHLCGLKAALKG